MHKHNILLYRLVYTYGYFPLSHDFCKFIALFRDLIGEKSKVDFTDFHQLIISLAYVDFNTLAATAACIAWNMWKPKRHILRKR